LTDNYLGNHDGLC